MNERKPPDIARTSALLALCLLGLPAACDAFDDRDSSDPMPPFTSVGTGGNRAGVPPAAGRLRPSSPAFATDGGSFVSPPVGGGDGAQMVLGDGATFWNEQAAADRDAGDDDAGR